MGLYTDTTNDPRFNTIKDRTIFIPEGTNPTTGKSWTTEDIVGSKVTPTLPTGGLGTGGGKAPEGYEYGPQGKLQTINSGTIAPTTQVPYVSPQPTTISGIPSIDATPPLAPTPKEKSLSDLIGEITSTSGLAGQKEAYRTEREKAANLETLKQSEADYTAQLGLLKADYANVENRMQLGAEGRGITAGGLAPLTMGEQRKISIQANTVGALLAATQGKITFAQAQVDRAVNDKYAQAEADRKAKIENLELLSKDPTLTLEQKNRADAQLRVQKKEDETAAKKKTDAATIMKWATDAAANGATPAQAQAIAQIGISDNPDLQTAMGLYAPFAAKKEKKWSEPYQLYPGGDYVIRDSQTGDIKLATNVPTPKESPTPFGAPTAEYKAVVMQYLAGNPQANSTVDIVKLESDPTYFWWVYNSISK